MTGLYCDEQPPSNCRCVACGAPCRLGEDVCRGCREQRARDEADEDERQYV